MGVGKALVLVGGARAKRRPSGRKDWTATKERKFLEALSDTCNVTLAAKIAGVGNTTVYSRRAKDAAFRDGWVKAIAQGYARLELEMIERALKGSVRVIEHRDGRKETVVEYPDRVALTLLKMHRDTAAEPERIERQEAEYSEEEVAELRQRIFDKLMRLRALPEPPDDEDAGEDIA